MRRIARRLLVLALVAGVTGAAVGTTVAAFTASTTTSGPSFSVKRVSSAARADSAWSVSDAADGSASDASDDTAFADSLFHTTKALSTTWSTSRYVEFQFNSPGPAGLDATSVTFDLDFSDAAGGGGETTCVYFEVRRRSTGAVLSTHGSSGTPFACETAAVMTRTSTSITAAVPDGDVANDLAVRIYVQNSSAGKLGRIDLAQVRFTRFTRTWTLHRTRMVDASDGVVANDDWGLVAAGDSAFLQTSGNWSNAYSGTRYVDFVVPSNVPSGATVTGASLKHAYKSATAGDTSCWYAQVLSGGSVIGTYGSTGSSISCNATTSFVTDTVNLAAVDTGAEANDLTIRVFMTNSGNRRTHHDLLEVTTTYSMPATGCVAPGPTTVTATRDSWADQNAPTSTGGATGTEGRIKTQDGSRNRRSFFYFPFPSTPDGCSVTGATLRLYGSSVQGTRTIAVYRAASAWTEAGLNWNTMPATAGTAVTTTNVAGWRTWDVLAHVQAMSSGSNEGFVVRDATEDSATAAEQRYETREGANPPQLVFTFG